MLLSVVSILLPGTFAGHDIATSQHINHRSNTMSLDKQNLYDRLLNVYTSMVNDNENSTDIKITVTELGHMLDCLEVGQEG
jgi:hypothetical protein